MPRSENPHNPYDPAPCPEEESTHNSFLTILQNYSEQFPLSESKEASVENQNGVWASLWNFLPIPTRDNSQNESNIEDVAASNSIDYFSEVDTFRLVESFNAYLQYFMHHAEVLNLWQHTPANSQNMLAAFKTRADDDEKQRAEVSEQTEVPVEHGVSFVGQYRESIIAVRLYCVEISEQEDKSQRLDFSRFQPYETPSQQFADHYAHSVAHSPEYIWAEFKNLMEACHKIIITVVQIKNMSTNNSLDADQTQQFLSAIKEALLAFETHQQKFIRSSGELIQQSFLSQPVSGTNVPIDDEPLSLTIKQALHAFKVPHDENRGTLPNIQKTEPRSSLHSHCFYPISPELLDKISGTQLVTICFEELNDNESESVLMTHIVTKTQLWERMIQAYKANKDAFNGRTDNPTVKIQQLCDLRITIYSTQFDQSSCLAQKQHALAEVKNTISILFQQEPQTELVQNLQEQLIQSMEQQVQALQKELDAERQNPDDFQSPSSKVPAKRTSSPLSFKKIGMIGAGVAGTTLFVTYSSELLPIIKMVATAALTTPIGLGITVGLLVAALVVYYCYKHHQASSPPIDGENISEDKPHHSSILSCH